MNKQLCSFASASSLGNVLLSVQDEGQCKELYRRYLHDFVHSVHQCYHQKDNLEYQVFWDSLTLDTILCFSYIIVDTRQYPQIGFNKS